MSFSDIRGGTAGQAGYLGAAHNPFLVEGSGDGGKGDKTKIRVRGVQLPAEFGLEELENRADVKAARKTRKEKGGVPLAKVKARLGMK